MDREFFVTLKNPETSWLDILKVVTTALASIAIPAVLFIVGTGIEESTKNKELETKYVEISVGILTEPPSPETQNLRKWAIDNINEYAPIELPEEAQEELNTEALPSIRSSARTCAQNYTVPSSPRNIEYVVVTDTENASLKGTISTLCRPETNASYHYIIGTDGTIEKLVDEENIAWHAGRSSWEGKENLNSISIGIGLVHLATPDGQNWLNLPSDHPAVGPQYPEAQLAALVMLLNDILQRYDLQEDQVLTKQDIAPDRRRTDLFGKPMEEIRKRLSSKTTSTE